MEIHHDHHHHSFQTRFHNVTNGHCTITSFPRIKYLTLTSMTWIISLKRPKSTTGKLLSLIVTCNQFPCLNEQNFEQSLICNYYMHFMPFLPWPLRSLDYVSIHLLRFCMSLCSRWKRQYLALSLYCNFVSSTVFLLAFHGHNLKYVTICCNVYG